MAELTLGQAMSCNEAYGYLWSECPDPHKRHHLDDAVAGVPNGTRLTLIVDSIEGWHATSDHVVVSDDLRVALAWGRYVYGMDRAIAQERLVRENGENAGWGSSNILDLVMAKIRSWALCEGNAQIVADMIAEEIQGLLERPIFEREARERARHEQIEAGQAAMPWW